MPRRPHAPPQVAWLDADDDGLIGPEVESVQRAGDELLGVGAGDGDVEAIGDPGQLERGRDAFA
jgi:hypothetical protein